ncbi:MAG: ribonuclease P protein component 3 [Euryarchaeota archaeon]|nr:ribonuclease P protein component 3 [Euryarchaeota archaeon]
MFTDLHVHSLHSSGADTPAFLRKLAKSLGVELCLCDGVVHEGIASGMEVHADTRRELLSEVRKSWKRFDFLLVHGGSMEINRSAVRDSRVDALLHPYAGRKDCGVDTVVARYAAEQGVAIAVELEDIVTARGIERAKVLSHFREILRLSRKYGFSVLATSGARCRYALRSLREGVALLECCGFSEDEALRALQQVPEGILEKKRRARREVSRGVRFA